MPVVSGHVMPVDAAPRLARRLAAADLATIAIPGLSGARVGTMPDAAALLVPLVRQLKSSQLVVSTSGLREGLLFGSLPADLRRQDPLILAAEAEGRRFARFVPHGRAIEAWIAPLFVDDDAAAMRLRLAACLLSDVASTANPDFRDERAAEMALHGQWLGIDLSDRLVLAQALFASAGGSGRPFAARTDPGLDARLLRAGQWGLAIRLAQRLSGGALTALEVTRIERGADVLRLIYNGSGADFAGEQVDKRLRQLASGLGLKAETVR
jgi:exopolyphosphatase/guanosine-5'-triphosphate,3'-diphosphate pyrophosphatase